MPEDARDRIAIGVFCGDKTAQAHSLGPISQEYRDAIKQRLDRLLKERW